MDSERWPPVTFRSELRRGVDGYNLRVGAAIAMAAGAVMLAAARAGWITGRPEPGHAWAAIGLVASFSAVTGLHTAVHAYFGWRFERGMAASAAGDHARAVRLLAVVERAGMDHYDLGGHARRALVASRGLRRS